MVDSIDNIRAWVMHNCFNKRNFTDVSNGVVDAFRPVVLNIAGYLDTTILPSTAALLDRIQTWTAAQTFSVAPKVPGGINAETFALDSSASSNSLTTGQQLPVSASGAFSGLLILDEPASGALAVYICAGGAVVKVSESTGSIFTESDGVTASRIDVSYTSSKYQIKNTFASTKTVLVMALRVRAAA